MKNLKFGNLILGICLMTTGLMISCTDLEVEEVDSIIIETTGDGFVAGDPVELLNSAYQDLGSLTNQADEYSLGVHTSDELIPPTRGVDWGDNGVWRTLHAHTWDPTHSFVLNAWNNLNSRAFKCNQILASNPDAQTAAEAKFLRALYTSYLVDYFGQVPIRQVTEGVGVDPTVRSREQAMNDVIADLESAIPDLPAISPTAGNTQASKAAAYALLSRVLLNKAVYTSGGGDAFNFEAGDMNKVIEYADLVEAEGYSLDPDYFNSFTTEGASEVILTSPQGTPQNRWMMTLHYSQNPSGWNGFTTLGDFYDKFDAADQRIGAPAEPDGSEFSGIGTGFLIGQQFDDAGAEVIDNRTQLPLKFTRDVTLAGTATDKGIRVIKYHPGRAGNYIVLRFGEVMLNKAEAILRGGSGDKSALEAVNELRAARGATALGSLDESTMLDERGREMYWEGFRRTDQIRFGTFTNTWEAKSVTEAHRVLFPIPQQALDSNPNLQQNPGY